MTQADYRDVLWVLTPQEDDSELCLLRSYADETALFETKDAGRSVKEFKVRMPVTKLVGSRDYKTRWTQDRVDTGAALEAGRKLHDALPPELLQILDPVPNDPRPLLLKIYSAQSHITDLPWEWLTDNSGNPIALRPDVRLVRSIPARFEIPHLTVPLPVRVLVVLTNPKDERMLDASRELAIATSNLVQPSYHMDVCPEPTVEILKDRLHYFLPHIVHYIGHAGINNGEGNIILHDSNNRTYWLTGAFLSSILPLTVRLICLSTCVTTTNYQILGLPHLAHTSSEQNLPTVVANRYPIGEASARAFWDTFYDALVHENGNVSEAIHHARRAAHMADGAFADWASFSLVLRDRTGRALKIVKASSQEISQIQAKELQAQYAARLASELAEQVGSYGERASPEVRQTFESASKDAHDLLEVAGDLSEGL